MSRSRAPIDSDEKIDDADNKDSALGGMTPQTSTMSVQSSVYNYVEENGRTYHRYKEGSTLNWISLIQQHSLTGCQNTCYRMTRQVPLAPTRKLLTDLKAERDRLGRRIPDRYSHLY